MHTMCYVFCLVSGCWNGAPMRFSCTAVAAAAAVALRRQCARERHHSSLSLYRHRTEHAESTCSIYYDAHAKHTIRYMRRHVYLNFARPTLTDASASNIVYDVCISAFVYLATARSHCTRRQNAPMIGGPPQQHADDGCDHDNDNVACLHCAQYINSGRTTLAVVL